MRHLKTWIVYGTDREDRSLWKMPLHVIKPGSFVGGSCLLVVVGHIVLLYFSKSNDDLPLLNSGCDYDSDFFVAFTSKKCEMKLTLFFCGDNNM